MNTLAFARFLARVMVEGASLPLATADTNQILPAVDDTPLYLGNGTVTWDLRVYGSAAANYISWDASADDMKFEDNVSIMFGTGTTAGQGAAGDIECRWDGTDLDILQLTANSSIKFGVDGAGIDIVLYGDTASATCTWDQSADYLLFAGVAGLRVEGTGLIGYGVGAGGTVTQATNKTTGVTLSKQNGTIVMNGAALAADTTAAFTLTNTLIAANDMVIVTHDLTGTIGAYSFGVTPAAGSALISVHNNTPGSLSEAIQLRYAVLKGSVT